VGREGDVKYLELEPHSLLHESVKCFWIHEASFPRAIERDITPDGCVELIFNFGSPYLLLTTNPPTELPTAFIVGFQHATLPIRLHGTVKVVAARLFAWAALALLQDNVDTRTNAVTPLGPGWGSLLERLKSAVSQARYEEAAKALEEFLMERERLRTSHPKLIQIAARLLHDTGGENRVADLADDCQASARQLERGFQRVVGTSPKVFSRVLRFDKAQRRLMFDPDAGLTELAHECGYSDQAHFIKEFKAFTGKTPTQYARQMRAMQDVLRSKDVVFLQSALDRRG
jgi:AraC-like DNA-binding protein